MDSQRGLWGVVSTAVFGGLGGVLAPALVLANLLTTDPPKTVQNPLGWVCGAAIFFALGALVATAAGERNLAKAVAIGIGLPAMVQIKGLPLPDTGTAPGPVSSSSIGQLVGAAFAQQASSGILSVAGDNVDLNGLNAVFFGANNEQIGVPQPATQNSIPIPSGSSTVAINGPDGWSTRAQLPNNSGATIKLTVSEHTSFVRSFRQALGLFSGLYEIDLSQ